MAKSLGLDISQVVPAEGSKRVVEADVRRAYERFAADPPAYAVPKTSARARKVIAMRMEESFRTDFDVHAEVDAALLAKVREEMPPILEEPYHVRLTYNDPLVKAITMTLRAMTNLNCYWNQGEIVSRSEINVGLAV